MNVGDLAQKELFTVLNTGSNTDQEISGPFCCDLLSICMSRMPINAAWVTVMANINTLAVLTLTDATCIILAEGTAFDGPALDKAKEEGITVFQTKLPVFEAALTVKEWLNG